MGEYVVVWWVPILSIFHHITVLNCFKSKNCWEVWSPKPDIVLQVSLHQFWIEWKKLLIVAYCTPVCNWHFLFVLHSSLICSLLSIIICRSFSAVLQPRLLLPVSYLYISSPPTKFSPILKQVIGLAELLRSFPPCFSVVQSTVLFTFPYLMLFYYVPFSGSFWISVLSSIACCHLYS